ncbi:MAG: molybdate ABC transporter substrate-binding protein [Gemmataceae bacterium]
MNRSVLLAISSLLVFLGLAALLTVNPFFASNTAPSTGKLVVFCAAGIKAPIAALAETYQKSYGVEIQLQYGGSNTLLSQLQVAPLADLYIPADESYVAQAREKKLIAEVLPLASMKPVLVVSPGNPKKIANLADLLTRDVKISQATPDAAAVGKVVAEHLKASGQWDRFAQRISVQKPTVNDVATDVQLAAADAGFVWDVTVKQMPELTVIPAGQLPSVNLSACIVRESKQPTAALRFARYLASADKGNPVFSEHGYTPIPGDTWAETPELKLFAGSMLRPATEKIIEAFEKREGCIVTRVYNGCGILVGQMRVDQNVPDAYFACDREFMEQVSDLFDAGTTISANQLVILVHKGNPHHIKKLGDLGKPGLRVGIGHEKQCAMGVLTQRTLAEDKTTSLVMKNVTVQSPTGDMLVNQMLTGSLDAVVAYITNAAGHADKLEAIPINIPCAFAEQPYAVGKKSTHRYLAARLLDAIRADESRVIFEKNGFTWKGQ